MHLNFFTAPAIPEDLPDSLQAEIDRLRSLSDKKEVLQTAYDVLTAKYRGYRLRTLTRLWQLFDDDVAHIWSKSGFLHCTSSNYLLKIMLLGSGKFSERDIKFRWTLIYFWSPHEYVQVRLVDAWVDIDLWGKAYGIAFGSHAHGSKSGSRTAVV